MHNNSEVDTLIKWPRSPHLLHAVAPPPSAKTLGAGHVQETKLGNHLLLNRQDGKCSQETSGVLYGLVLSCGFLSGR
jgi:hypothetical protein